MTINQRIHIQNNKKFFCKKTNVDIPVYKVMKKYFAGEYHGWTYETPVMFYELDINRVYTTVQFEQFTHDVNINHGYHTFTSLQMAKKFIKNLNGYKLVVFKAIIPRGSMYYFGYNGQVISNSLKLIEEI